MLKKQIRWFLLLCALGVVVGALALPGLAQVKPRLFVFVPSEYKPRLLQKELQGTMPSLEVTVFGRTRDFLRGVQDQSPEAVMAPTPVLESLGLSASVQGLREGARDEAYVLVSIDRPLSPEELAGQTVGAYGLLRRKEMKSFCGKLLSTGKQKVKTVTKFADLLPLLQFEAAAAVILPKRYAILLTAKSQLKLVVSDLKGGRVGLPGVALDGPGARDTVVSALESMDKNTRKNLGVDAWK